MYKNTIITPLIAALLLLSLPFGAAAQKASELKYVKAEEFSVLINKGFENTELLYSRLPLDMKERTRPEVWSLGLNSAGLAIRFSTDSKCLGAKWELLNNYNMVHMPGTGIRGIDFYILDNEEWRFIGTAQPNGKISSSVFIRNMDGTSQEYMAYLPLYDGVLSIEIGIDSTASISGPQVSNMSASCLTSMSATGGGDTASDSHVAILARKCAGKISDGGYLRKPIVFYGTSITQGGCASRPGMCYTSIIGRKLRCESINLGFSGNARLDFSMAEIVSRIEASAYVIDCLPNCTPQIVRDSAYRFLTYLAEKHRGTPIYLVENIDFAHFRRDTYAAANNSEKNGEWNKLYKRLKREGFSNFYYIPANGLIGRDDEATVDGIHLTDLGFLRMADNLIRYLR